MSWMNKNLQEQILLSLKDSYRDPISIPELVRKIWPDEASINVTTEELFQNIKYLCEHDLIFSKDINSTNPIYALVEITSRGIDHLEPDGGLSASLGVITVKLHSDTIQQLLAAKIDQSDMPEAEKSELKTALTTIKSAALTTITEEAIKSAPWAALLAVLKQALL